MGKEDYSNSWGKLANGEGFTSRRVESAELQLSPLDLKLGDVAPRGPSKEEFGFLPSSEMLKRMRNSLESKRVNIRHGPSSVCAAGPSEWALDGVEASGRALCSHGSERTSATLHTVPTHAATAAKKYKVKKCP